MKSLFLDDEQCQLLRECMDFVPLTPRYIHFVVDILQRVPEQPASSAMSEDLARVLRNEVPA